MTEQDRLLRRDEVRRRLGNIPNSSLYDLVRRGVLPGPYRIPGSRSVAWRESDIRAFLDKTFAEGPVRNFNNKHLA